MIGIPYWTTDTDDKIHYGCKGSGPRYIEFYEWIKTTSYKCTSEDFPWDYFIFEDPKDDAEILIQFGDCMWNDDED